MPSAPDHLHRVAAARLGPQGVDGHDQGIGDRAGGDRHVHRRLVPRAGGGRVGRVHQHGDGRPEMPSRRCRSTGRGGHGAHRGDHPRRGLVVGQGDGHLVADRHLGLLGGVEGDADLAGGRGRRQHGATTTAPRSRQPLPTLAPPPPPTDSPTDGGDRGDPDRAGLEDHLAEQDLAGRRQAEGALPPFDRGGGGCGVVVALGQPGAVAEGDQVGGQLAHIGAVGHADVERPVGGDGAVEERHRLVVERVDRLVLLDDVAHLRQRGVGRARVHLGGLLRRQGGLVALQLGLVGGDLGLVLVVVKGGGRLGARPAVAGPGSAAVWSWLTFWASWLHAELDAPVPAQSWDLVGLVRAEGGLVGVDVGLGRRDRLVVGGRPWRIRSARRRTGSAGPRSRSAGPGRPPGRSPPTGRRCCKQPA